MHDALMKFSDRNKTVTRPTCTAGNDEVIHAIGEEPFSTYTTERAAALSRFTRA
jgi:hypothetical protein